MLKVSFYELNTLTNDQLKFAVIMARYEGKWILVRHKDRTTWEIPGGHREENEDINDTASRELIEETGSKAFCVIPVCIYSVHNGEAETFGQLFYADIECLEDSLAYEIGEVGLFESIPENLTYPLIQPYLYHQVEEFIDRKRTDFNLV